MSAATSAMSDLPIPVKGMPMVGDYTQSFSVQDAKAYKAFYDEYGFVVIHDVLTAKECEETIADIWSIVEGKSCGLVKRTDPQTWGNSVWHKAAGPLSKSEGMIGTGAIFTPIAVRNRANPRMLQVAQQLLNESKLLVSHDRYGLFRPTKPHATWAERATMGNLHLDMNPWRPVGGLTTQQNLKSLTYDDDGLEEFLDENNLPLQLPSIQMLINLADNKEADGGLQVVPRFPQKYLADWIESSRLSLFHAGLHDLEDNFIRLTATDPLHAISARVTARPGSLIVWDKRMVHGSLPNASHRPRYAQFFLMSAAPQTLNKLRAKSVTHNLIKNGIDPASLSKSIQQLFGLVPY